MNGTAWDLPGPAAFVERAAEHVRGGDSVVVVLPDPAPDHLAAALGQALMDWEPVTVPAAAPRPPVELLYSCCLPASTTALRTAEALAGEAGLAGHVVFVQGVREADWPAWSDFVHEYADEARARPPAERARFVLFLSGLPEPPSPRDRSPGVPLPLAVLPWRRALTPLDLVVYSTRTVREGAQTPLERRASAEMVARLAGFDFDVADRLSRLSFEELHQPVPFLTGLARERGWPEGEEAADALQDPTWHTGFADVVDGTTCTHPALLAAAGDVRAVRRRIWSAHLATVFPFIEECRQDLLEVLGAQLYAPFSHPFGTVADRGDLEIGHISRQLDDDRSADPVARDLAYQLKEARNELAHLRPLRPAFFRHPAVVGHADRMETARREGRATIS